MPLCCCQERWGLPALGPLLYFPGPSKSCQVPLAPPNQRGLRATLPVIQGPWVISGGQALVMAWPGSQPGKPQPLGKGQLPCGNITHKLWPHPASSGHNGPLRYCRALFVQPLPGGGQGLCHSQCHRGLSQLLIKAILYFRVQRNPAAGGWDRSGTVRISPGVGPGRQTGCTLSAKSVEQSNESKGLHGNSGFSRGH
jgi:hypothetical protein